MLVSLRIPMLHLIPHRVHFLVEVSL